MIHWLIQTSHACPEIGRGVAPVGLLSAHEQERLAALRVPKRRHDWLLGRWTAKHLLQAALLETRQLSAALDRIEIDNDAAGAPFARLIGAGAGGAVPAEPLPASLSISHSGDRAFCAVHWQDADRAAAIGCDIERIEPRDPSFVRAYFTEAEAAAVATAPAALSPLLVTALWSAKEAVLKAWRIGLRVDTRTIDCDLGSASGRAPGALFGAEDRPWQPLSAQVSGQMGRLAAPASGVDGWWRVDDGYVMTLAVRHVA
jgi:4'-phosphopantetheinyl transferase